jgi:hypothetical protein
MREIEIGGIANAGVATITNWPGRAASSAGSSVRRRSVEVSAVSGWTSTTVAGTYSMRSEAGPTAGAIARMRVPGARTGAPASEIASPGVPWSAVVAGLPAIAASSSRTSIPTGHHAMHRPQPTQPELPNCSHHVPNLWVSHCR